MELTFHGANCIKIANKKTSVIIDDNLAALGGKSVATAKDIVLLTGDTEHPKDSHFTIDLPGEYEVSDVSVQGIAARSHIAEAASDTSTTMYRIIIDGVRIAVTGHIYPNLSDTQLEALGTIDVLFVPVGGNGYTLDAGGAQKIIKAIEPKIVVPTHYAGKGLKYEVPQTELEDALKNLAMEPVERLDVLKMKNAELSDTTRLVVLEQK